MIRSIWSGVYFEKVLRRAEDSPNHFSFIAEKADGQKYLWGV